MENELVALTQAVTIFWVFIGILISLILPIAVKTLQGANLEELDKDEPTIWQRIVQAWKAYSGNKYLMIFLSAVVVAFVLVFLLGLNFFSARDAALAGFAWESLINKLFAKQ